MNFDEVFHYISLEAVSSDGNLWLSMSFIKKPSESITVIEIMFCCLLGSVIVYFQSISEILIL